MDKFIKKLLKQEAHVESKLIGLNMQGSDFEKVFILEHLLDEERELFFSNTTKVLYSKGERIFKEGEFVSYGLFIIKGYVKIHTEVKGKEIILNILGPDKIAGFTTMLTFDKHVYSITALEDTTVLQFSINTLKECIEKNGKFARQVIDYINNSNIHYLKHNLLAISQNNIHGRLANTLLYLSEKVFCKTIFDVMLSRKELAQFSKISRENVIKTLYEFQNDGLIRLNGKQIEITNANQLKKIAFIS